MNKKYLVIGGHVTSRIDGDWHYISATKLVDLYDVPRSECVLYETANKRMDDIQNIYDMYPELKVLRPLCNGNYPLVSRLKTA